MTLVTAGLQFNERYYRWSLEQWEKEISSGFPLLKSVHSEGSQTDVAILESLPRHEQLRMAVALAKRFRQDQLPEWGEVFTEEDQRYSQLFIDQFRKIRNIKASKYHPEDFSRLSRNRKARLKRLRKCVIDAVAPILGQDYEHRGGWKEWVYITQIGEWLIITSIDIGGHYDISYEHSIVVSEKSRLIEGISLNSWLGLAGQTQWDSLGDENVPQAAMSLAKIIERFIKAAPKLLDGIFLD
jgi:hypothetical protein